MRIQSVRLKNIRLFGEEVKLEFDPCKNITILHGNNGCGKSTILDSIAILCSAFVSAFPEQAIKNFSDFDVHIGNGGERASYLNVRGEFQIGSNNSVNVSRARRGNAKSPESEVKEIKSAAESLIQAYKSGENVQFPVLAYYGTGRGQIEAPDRKRNFQKAYSRWDCYKSSLDAAANFKRFFAWYDLMEDEERRERERLHDFDYKSPVLEAVRNALNRCVSKYKNPRIEIHPLRFVMDEYDQQGQVVRQLRLEQMSDGFKIMIAMVSDIASRMAEANPDARDVLSTSGIVLIDEVDLHLHPKWQRDVLRQLNETFPNVQFIVTTHSPIVTLGATDIAQLIVLGNDGNIFPVSAEEFQNYDISQMLLSQLYELPSVRAPHWDKDINRRDELLAKPVLSDADKEELEDLDKRLRSLSYGESLAGMKMFSLVKEMSKKLGL